MTENQQKAYDYLQQWHEAQLMFEQLDGQVEYLRMKAENMHSSMAVSSGWTGRTISDKRGRKEKEYAPIARGAQPQGNARQEIALVDLADMSTKRDIQLKRCTELYSDIGNSVELLVESQVRRTILILRHLSGLSFSAIGEAIRLSSGYTRQLHLEALEEMGAKL